MTEKDKCLLTSAIILGASAVLQNWYKHLPLKKQESLESFDEN